MAEIPLGHHRGGAGPPLVLLHGLGLSRRAWEGCLAPLERRHDVLALDLPGFGDSPALPGRPVPSRLADSVELAMDAAGIETAHFAGNSLGGWLALELAGRGRALTVTAISPAGMWQGWERGLVEAELRLTHAAVRSIGPERLARGVAGRILVGAGRPWLVDRRYAESAFRDIAAGQWTRTLEAMLSSRPRGLGAVNCPVTIAWGALDALLLPRQAIRFAALIPQAEVRPLRGLGHVPMADAPGEVAALILGRTGLSEAGRQVSAGR